MNAAPLTKMEKLARDRKEIEIINRNARRLNREAMDVLEYQTGSRPGRGKHLSVHMRPAGIDTCSWIDRK